MKRTFVVAVLLSVLSIGQSLSLAAVPMSSEKAYAQGQFTAAETVIAQTGTIGHWAFMQPPGFPPVTRVYVSGISTDRLFNFRTPAIYPVDGFSNQKVDVGFRIFRRLPNGTRQVLFDFSNGAAAQTSFSSPTPGTAHGASLDLGSIQLVSVKIRWFDAAGATVIGSVELLYNYYQTLLVHVVDPSEPDIQSLPATDACYPHFPATANLGGSQGTVNQSIPFTLDNFPEKSPVTIYFDGKSIGSVITDTNSHASGNFIVPAAPLGNHAVKFFRYGRTATANFTIKPRIKIIPSTVSRNQLVNVSLRGFAAHETVRIRWKNGSTFVEIARVTTSSTGSANKDVRVPIFAPNGANSVRGDGAIGRAQTNAVMVSGSLLSSAAETATPTSSATKAATLSPTATATAMATATSSPSPTATQPEPTNTPQDVLESATSTPIIEQPAPIDATTTASPPATISLYEETPAPSR